jgi:hypothetical protein
MLAELAFAIFPPPSRVARTTVLTDQVNLSAANIIFERLLEGISEILPPVMGNLTRIGTARLRLEIVCRHLPKRTIENGDIILHAKPDSFDKAYCHYGWWTKIHAAGAFFITRPKQTIKLKVAKGSGENCRG